MVLKRNMKILSVAVCSLIIIGLSATYSSAERVNWVEDTIVSNLRVRKNPSVNAPILYTLSKGRDLVYKENTRKDVTESGISRQWYNYAYPDANQGKYTKSRLGWICSYDASSGSYTNSAVRTTFHSGQWIYNDSALTKKHKYINPGTYLRDVDKNPKVRHDMNNLNLWNLKTHDDNAQVGSYPKVRYFNGWMANATK